MLDLDHPEAGPTLHAAALMDGVMARGQRMSVAPSPVRADLLAECLPRFAELCNLARGPFARQAAFLLPAVAEYEAAIRSLAGLGDGRISADWLSEDGPCPACGKPITRHPEHKIVSCDECSKPFMAAYRKLDSGAGFGTWAI